MLLIKNSFRGAGALGLFMVAASAAQAGSFAPQKADSGSRAMDEARRFMSDRSARFVENKGQWNREAHFFAKGNGVNLWYTDRGIRYDQRVGDRRHAVDMFFVDGKVNHAVGAKRTKSRFDFYHGSVSAKGVASFHELFAKNVLPGVSMRSYYENNSPRYDLILAPNTDPSAIEIGFKGSTGLRVENSALKVGTQLGGFYNGKPIAYQMRDGKRVPVAAKWTVTKAGTAKFRLGNYDRSKVLVIDPLVYGSYAGGELGPDEVRAATIDPVGGGIVLVGSSASIDFPATTRPFTDTLNPQGVDAFFARTVPQADTTDYSVLIGGSGEDVAQYVKVDSRTGDIWIAGSTSTLPRVVTTDGNQVSAGTLNNFPSTALAGGARSVIGRDSRGATNLFIARFTHTSTGDLNFGSDQTGTNGAVTGNSIANPRVAAVFGLNPVDAVTTVTPSPDFAFVSSTVNANRKFLSGFDLRTRGGQIVQFAMTGITAGTAVATGPSGPPGSTGALLASNSAADNRAFPGRRAGFLVRVQVGGDAGDGTYFRVSPTGQYIQGSRVSETRGVALDPYGRAYVAGTVFRPTNLSTADPLNVDTAQFPSFFETRLGNGTSQTFDANGTSVAPRLLRSTDSFVRIYDSFDQGVVNPGALEYSVLLGGNGIDETGGAAMTLSGSPVYTGSAIAINADGNIYLTGTTAQAANFPYTAGSFGGGFVPGGAASSDVFVARIAIRRDGGILSSTGIVSSRLDYSANLKTTSRLLSSPAGNNRSPIVGPGNPLSIDTSSPSVLTSAEPSGIAVDARGYVYVTGNLRPLTLVFPDTFSAPSEPTSSSPSAIVVAGTAPLDTVYKQTASSGPYPTNESYLTVLSPTFSELQYSTYIGGDLDEQVYTPSFDSNGNVFVTGWTNGRRVYNVPARTAAAYDAVANLSGFIGNSSGAGVIKGNSPNILPQDQGVTSLFSSTVGVLPFAYGIYATQGDGSQSSIPLYTVARDGFVALIDVGLPQEAPLAIGFTINPATIEPLDSTVATVTVNVKQALDTRVKIASANGLPISSNALGFTNANALFDLQGVNYDSAGGYYYVIVSAGQTTTTFTIKSTKYGNGVTGLFNASLVDGSQLLTQTLAVRPLDYTVVLTKTDGSAVSASGLSSSETPATLTGTITIIGGSGQPRALPEALSFLVSVPATDSGTVTIPNPNVTIPAGSSTGTFTVNVNPVTTPVSITISATVQPAQNVDSSATIVRTTQIAVQPVSLVSVRATPNPIRSTSRTQLAVTVTFSGDPGENPAVAFDFSLRGAFRRATGSSLVRVPGTTNQFTAYFVPNRVSRSIDVTITASVSGTSARTTVTLLR